MTGLHAPVEVLLDGHGVPSIYARDPDDAWFAAGVMHARDRRWQFAFVGVPLKFQGATSSPLRPLALV